MLNILILEDSPEDAELIVHELKRAGFIFDWRRVEDESAFLIHSETADVIIADYTLPQFSAPRALEIVAQKGLDTPFIVVSGTIGEDTAVECMRQGASDYLLKDRLGRMSQSIERALLERDVLRQKKQAEKNLKLSERRFRTLLENAAIAIAVVRQKTYVYYNTEFTKLLEFSVNEDLPALEEMIVELREDAKYDTTIVTSTGKILPIYVTSNSIELPNGTAQLYSFIDLTYQRQLDDAKVKLEAMKISLAKERELTDLKERFASTVSHEYRTPLTIIATSATLLEKYFDQLKEPDRKKYLGEIKIQVDYMTMLLNDVLVLSSTDTAALRVNRAPLNIIEFCSDTIEQVRLVDADQHSIEFFFSGQIEETVNLDQRLLKHIVLNLMLNAAKYSKNETLITLTVVVNKTDVQLLIEDRGIGIPQKDQPHLFGSFFRGSNVREINGTGLGLAIVKRSIEAQHGSISFTSQEGVGTTFQIILPL